jgi:hypothetical protein
MPLDYALIERNCQQAKQSIAQLIPTTNQDLWLVRDFVSEDILSKLEEYIEHVDAGAWSQVAGQESLPRHKITWESDSVIEELHDVCASITADLELKFDRQLTFAGIQIWRDTESYYISQHTDNPVIDISLQLYIFDAPSSCGTTFFLDHVRFVIGFFHNTGYVCVNHNTEHETTAPVPRGTTRYSLYAHWTSRPAMPTGQESL